MLIIIISSLFRLVGYSFCWYETFLSRFTTWRSLHLCGFYWSVIIDFFLFSVWTLCPHSFCGALNMPPFSFAADPCCHDDRVMFSCTVPLPCSWNWGSWTVIHVISNIMWMGVQCSPDLSYLLWFKWLIAPFQPISQSLHCGKEVKWSYSQNTQS